MAHASPSREQWRALFERARQVHHLAPWQWMNEVDLFGVRPEDAEETSYVSVLGALGEHHAVVVYRGETALGQMLNLHAGPAQPDAAQQILEMSHVHVSFVDRRELDTGDRRLLKSLGLRFKGPHAWPDCKLCVPGYQLQTLRPDDAVLLTRALEQLLDVAPRFRADDQVLYPADSEAFLVRVQQGRSWHDAYEEPQAVSMPWEQNQADVFTVRQLSKLDRRPGALEVDFFGTPSVVKDKESPPYFVYALIAVDPDTGLVLGVDPLGSVPSFQHMWQQLPARLAGVLDQTGGLPEVVRLQSERVASALAPALQAVGVQIEVVEQLPELNQARAGLERYLLRGGGPGELAPDAGSDGSSATPGQDEAERPGEAAFPGRAASDTAPPDHAPPPGRPPAGSATEQGPPFGSRSAGPGAQHASPFGGPAAGSASSENQGEDMDWVDPTDLMDLYAMAAAAVISKAGPATESASESWEAHRRERDALLNSTSITPEGPGSILRDAQVVLEAAAQGIQLTVVDKLPKVRHTQQINDRLAHPVRPNMTRPQPRSYPGVRALYTVLVSAGLIRPGHSGGTAVLDEEAASEWEQLSPAERYFTLLEAWLCGRDPELPLGSAAHSSPLMEWLDIQGRLALDAQGIRQPDAPNLELLRQVPGLTNIALMEIFGLAEIVTGDPQPSQGWIVQQIHGTAWGTALSGRMVEYLETEHAAQRQQEKGTREAPAAQLKPVYAPYFPEFQRALSVMLPPPRLPRTGPGSLAHALEVSAADIRDESLWDEAEDWEEVDDQTDWEGGDEREDWKESGEREGWEEPEDQELLQQRQGLIDWQKGKDRQELAGREKLREKAEPQAPHGVAEAMYVFKVALAKTWRRLAIAGSCSVHELAEAIVDAFDFDFDHLYSFTVGGSRNKAPTYQVHHPGAQEPPSADQTAVSDLPLDSGQRMEFLYDYGDEWRFKVELEAVTAEREWPQPITHLDGRGRAPRQY